ncbi:MAG: hypothetical protein ATN33_02375 [Epulopiscium sp. Nele67-Bin001]|nr:MAG: hypothetical protein ATN33_02375 [Epulopiscium sp. Nele67-Bin001]
MDFILQPLPYTYDALEPIIDKETIHLHHDKYQQAYVNELNTVISKYPELFNKTVGQLLYNLDILPNDIKQDVFIQGGGVFSYSFFWEILSTEHNQQPAGSIKEAIEKTFHSIDILKAQFKKYALSGSSWAWLVKHPNYDLEVVSSIPITNNLIPLIAIGLWWEPDYIENVFNVLDWKKADEFYNLDIIEFVKRF